MRPLALRLASHPGGSGATSPPVAGTLGVLSHPRGSGAPSPAPRPAEGGVPAKTRGPAPHAELPVAALLPAGSVGALPAACIAGLGLLTGAGEGGVAGGRGTRAVAPTVGGSAACSRACVLAAGVVRVVAEPPPASRESTRAADGCRRRGVGTRPATRPSCSGGVSACLSSNAESFCASPCAPAAAPAFPPASTPAPPTPALAT